MLAHTNRSICRHNRRLNSAIKIKKIFNFMANFVLTEAEQNPE